jgi:hypothetical protein
MDAGERGALERLERFRLARVEMRDQGVYPVVVEPLDADWIARWAVAHGKRGVLYFVPDFEMDKGGVSGAGDTWRDENIKRKG